MIYSDPESFPFEPETVSFPEMVDIAPNFCAPFLKKGPTMSSMQIAGITGKLHRNVTADIARILAEAEIDALEFQHIYLDPQNRKQICYHLPRRECDLVISGYSVKYRLAIIDRWQELEAKVAAPPAPDLFDPTTLRTLLLDNVEKVIALQTTVLELTPKAEALDLISEATGEMNITNAAKILQVQPKALFMFLQVSGWIYRRNGSEEWVPYQSRIQAGLMVAKAHTILNQVTGEQMIRERALITAKGITILGASFSKNKQP